MKNSLARDFSPLVDELFFLLRVVLEVNPSSQKDFLMAFHLHIGSSTVNPGAILDEPTWRCHQNPFVGALRIQEPVILGEPQSLFLLVKISDL